MRRKSWLFLLCVAMHLLAKGQELNCKVTMQVDPQVNRPPEQRLIEGIEKEFSAFLSQNKWTDEDFETKERIVCNLRITLKENPAPNEYVAHTQLLSVRPIYDTNYQSVLLNYVDEGFNFAYVPGQPLQYTTNFFSSNLESMLIFYAYLFIGMDFDSFAPLGGTPYFERAREIVNLAQQTNDKHWTSFGSTRNRYWLMENLLRKDFEAFRTGYYVYHREGMDNFIANPKLAREKIFSQLQTTELLLKRSRNTIVLSIFLDSKYQEIIQIFTRGESTLSQKAYELMSRMDPARTASYKAIIKP